MDFRELKKELDRLYREINRPEFIQSDPVQFPHRFRAGPDQEIAAFLAASIAWGRRDLILRSAEKMFSLMDWSPYAFVMEGGYKKLKDRCIRRSGPLTQGNDNRGRSRGLCVHRTFFEDDLLYFCKGFKACYAKYGSLENLFAAGSDMWEGIGLFRETMARGNSGSYSKHISGPEGGSACKRLHLALRWLVRREGPVDLGLWKSISPSSLFIPLDLHAGRTARRLGLLERKSNDKKAVIALTEKLRAFCPGDPAKYDLALFGVSVQNDTSQMAVQS